MKILIAHDGTECSDAAIVDLKRAGLPNIAEAVVLSVAEPCPQLVAAPYGAMAAAGGICFPQAVEDDEAAGGRGLQEAQAFAAEAADRLRADFPGWQINTEAWVDQAGSAIARKARGWRPDLVVVGSHGCSGFRRLVLGSVSQYVLHHAGCSVRISRHHLHSQERSVRLLIGFDGSPCAMAALEAVAIRNWPAGTEARVVGVMDCASLSAHPFTVTPEALPLAVEENWQRELSTTIRQGADRLNGSGLRATGQVLEGNPGTVLLREAEKCSADCVFVGARGRNALERFLLGSVSMAVASHASCSVEVARSSVP